VQCLLKALSDAAPLGAIRHLDPVHAPHCRTTGRIISYGMCIVFIGVFVNLTVRRALVIDYNLPYPTGTAVGTMIRSFFNDGRSARRQALMLAKTGLAAFAW